MRLPIPNSGRRLTYGAEASIGYLLEEQGLSVARWTVVEADGLRCSVAPLLSGEPVQAGPWSDELAGDVAEVLRALHQLPCRYAGPLAEDTPLTEESNERSRQWEGAADALEGTSRGLVSGICDRWFLATIWPFDRTELREHAIATPAPELLEPLRGHRAKISAAGESGPIGVCHSDLHAEHLLVDDRGRLSGLLDFGDAFIGAVAWDFALLLHYYGEANTEAVLAAYTAEETERTALLTQAKTLAIAVAAYKVAKSPDRPELTDKLREALDH